MRRKWHGLNILRRRAIRASLRKRGKHELVGDRSVTLIVSGITGVERDPHEAISRKFKAALGGIPRLHDCTIPWPLVEPIGAPTRRGVDPGRHRASSNNSGSESWLSFLRFGAVIFCMVARFAADCREDNCYQHQHFDEQRQQESASKIGMTLVSSGR
jgi:hypothetical protein